MLNKLLWSGVTAETQTALLNIYRPIFGFETEDEQKALAVCELIFYSMNIHNSNGDHVYYDTANSYRSRVEYFANMTIPIVKSIEFIFHAYDNSYHAIMKTPLPEQSITKTFSGDNDGMTEISPINATMGTITTPNTKSKYKAENTQNETYVTYDYEERKIKFMYSDYMNLAKYFHSIFVKLIVEWNRIY